MQQRGNNTKGFTLIEVLVAFTIAAVMLLPLLQSFSAGINSATRTDNFTEATLIAESALETAGPGQALVDGANSDLQEGRYHIATAVHRFQGDTTAAQPALLAIPYEVVVTVTWQEAARARSIALRTLRLGPPPIAEQGQ